MGKPSDRDRKYMRDMWGTEALVTDYGSFYDKNQKKMLREVENDEIDQKSKNIDACLLYTSPSPRDMRRSRMPSSA